MPKYDIEVKLVGEDGNAFVILGAVRKAMKRAGVDSKEIEEFNRKAMSGDYNHLLRTCMEYVDVC